MKNFRIVHRIKLKDYDLRVLVNILNEARLRQRAKGENNSTTCDLLLRCLDALEA